MLAVSDDVSKQIGDPVDSREPLENRDKARMLGFGAREVNDVVVQVIRARPRSHGEELGSRRMDENFPEIPDFRCYVDCHGVVFPSETGLFLLLPPMAWPKFVNKFTSSAAVRRIAESTVRRLSIYLSFLEEIEAEGVLTTSSDDLARLGGTTSAQVRKDLSFFGSFGKRGLGYSVPELSSALREILGLGKQWRVCIVGVGKVGSALARYAGFAERGFNVTGLYDSDLSKVDHRSGGIVIQSTD